MVCFRCGKEMADGAWICPGCGSATENYQAKGKPDLCRPQNDCITRDFEKKVECAYHMSVIALVLCLWIGVVFSLAAWMKMKRIAIPEVVTENLQSAKRKLARANQFALVPLIPWLLLGFFLLSEGLVQSSFPMILTGILAFVLFGILVGLGNWATNHLVFGGIEQVQNRKEKRP